MWRADEKKAAYFKTKTQAVQWLRTDIHIALGVNVPYADGAYYGQLLYDVE